MLELPRQSGAVQSDTRSKEAQTKEVRASLWLLENFVTAHFGFGHRADQFNSIESRIKRMESLLQSSDVANSLPQRSEISCSETIKEQTSPPGIDDLSNLMIGDTGAQKYIGNTGMELWDQFIALTSEQDLHRDLLYFLHEAFPGCRRKRARNN